jgi:hypothetical protein
VGYLTLETFSIALKLIACAQHGKEATEPILATGNKYISYGYKTT